MPMSNKPETFLEKLFLGIGFFLGMLSFVVVILAVTALFAWVLMYAMSGFGKPLGFRECYPMAVFALMLVGFGSFIK
jgi:hypothetical protein